MSVRDEADVMAAVRDAVGALRIVGGGTRGIGLVAGAELSLAGLTGIKIYEPGALTLVAAAGTPLAEVEAILAAEGQRMPFEAPDFRELLGRSGGSTLGGVVAANASGPRRVQAGACRDSLIGVRFVDGRGAVIKNGGRVMKNVTGYDLVKLMAGSNGTLGVLTEVAFKLLPVPEAEVTLGIAGLSDVLAVQAMSAALGSPFEVSGAAHVPGQGTYLRIEGFAASVAYRVQRLQGVLARYGGAEVVPFDWALVRDVQPFRGRMGDVWRLSVKPSDAPQIVARMGADAVIYDWGGGLIWALVGDGVDLRTRIGAFGGHATRLRGVASDIPTFQPESAGVAALTAGLRAQFDPRGILNAGLME